MKDPMPGCPDNLIAPIGFPARLLKEGMLPSLATIRSFSKFNKICSVEAKLKESSTLLTSLAGGLGRFLLGGS